MTHSNDNTAEFYSATAAIYAYTAKGNPTPVTVKTEDRFKDAPPCSGTYRSRLARCRPYVVTVHHENGVFAAAFACPDEAGEFHRNLERVAAFVARQRTLGAA